MYYISSQQCLDKVLRLGRDSSTVKRTTKQHTPAMLFLYHTHGFLPFTFHMQQAIKEGAQILPYWLGSNEQSSYWVNRGGEGV